MARARNGEAVRASLKTAAAIRQLESFVAEATKKKALDEWRRGRAVLGYVQGRRVVDLSVELEVARGSINRWLQWYDAAGLQGLKTLKAPGPSPKLRAEQLEQLSELVEGGPLAAGYQSGVWTGPMIRDLIAERFGVEYHAHHVPRLLNQLRFSVQRPRKRLARADVAQQDVWVREKFPAIKKKPTHVAGS